MSNRRLLLSLLGAVSASVPLSLGCSGNDAGTATPTRYSPPPAAQARPVAPVDVPPTAPGTPRKLGSVYFPPAISGGTLLVQKDGHTAVAADPDRDVVWIVDLAQQALTHTIALQPGDEPGRVAEDGAGRVHVILRSGGALVSIDPQAGTVLARREVCPAPRGLGYDPAADVLHVACADGTLTTFPAAGGDAVRTVSVDGDLRDVVVQGGNLYVTRFRSAQVLQLDGTGALQQRITLPTVPNQVALSSTLSPSVAWRTVALPGGNGLVVLHQRAQEEPVPIQPSPGQPAGTYGQPIPGPEPTIPTIVQDAVTVVQPGQAPPSTAPLELISLAVDVAVSPDGATVAIAAPGVTAPNPSTVRTFSLAATQAPGACSGCSKEVLTPGPATAVTFSGQGHLVFQTRDPARIVCPDLSVEVELPGADVRDTGHAIFHGADTGSFLACASCHPEGGDDGRVWQFVGLGPRRTQNLGGGVMERTPFHWGGDIPNMDQLVSEVFVGRMGGRPLDSRSIVALGDWLGTRPALSAPAPADPSAVSRGEKIFTDPTVGCLSCHNGPQLSNHQLVDVGTGGLFKVPSLIAVRYRAPYLHDGCAATLLDRFTNPACNTPDLHGHTSQLTSSQIADLVTFLETL